MTDHQSKFVDPILNTFVNNDIKEFAVELLNTLPDYVWHVGASSTGKYHPEYSLGDGGLMRHQVAVVRFLNFFFELEQYNKGFTDREMDLMRVAGLIHDGRKSGEQSDYEKSKYTKFDHPVRMAEVVKAANGLTQAERDFIAHCIESHMGQWNVDKKTKFELNKPNDDYQKLVHLADYLASRKDLTMAFDNYEVNSNEANAKAIENFDIDNYVLPFGKHKGVKLIDVYKNTPDYVAWMKSEIQRKDVQDAIAALEKKISEEEDDL